MDKYFANLIPQIAAHRKQAPVFELLMIASEWRCDEADMAVAVDTPLLWPCQ